MEVPVNVNFVEGFGEGEVVYSREEAAAFFKEQEEATNLPYIYLSAGVSAKLFQETLEFAHASGANFNGVLCGRATWAGSVEAYIKDGEAAAREWLRTEGRQNIEELNAVLAKVATTLDRTRVRNKSLLPPKATILRTFGRKKFPSNVLHYFKDLFLFIK